MSNLSAGEVRRIEGLCSEILEDPNIRFAGAINTLGHLFAGGFKQGVVPHESDEKQRMMYMQIVLDISMRQDFDDSLGEIEHITSKRKNAMMISIPKNGYLLLISAEPHSNDEKIIRKINQIYDKEKILDMSKSKQELTA